MKTEKIPFSGKVFWEGVRQCRLIGILSAVVIALGAFFLPIWEMVGASKSDYHTKTVYDIWSINPALCLVVAAAPLMTLALFHFLNSRAASDFYHALSHRRVTLYTSFACAVLFWVVLLLALGTLLSLLGCGIGHNYITLLYDEILPYCLSLFVICFLTISGILLAMSVTGTLFTNILFSAILLFLPRICMVCLHGALLSPIPFVSGLTESGFLQSNNNLLFAICNYLFSINDSSSTLSAADILSADWQSLLYTFLLGLIYFGLGMFLFYRRPSEAAGRAAPSKLLQHVYRIVVTMTFCVFVTASLYTGIAESTVDRFGYVMLYLIAVLIYFAYELITTRRWHNLLTALPGLGIVVLLNGGILLGMHIAQNQIVTQRPSAQEIESVSFRNTDTTGDGDYLDYTGYVDMMGGKVKITDDTVLSLVSYYLDENIQTWEDGGSNAYYNKYASWQTYTDVPESAEIAADSGSTKINYSGYYVTIRTAGKTLDRIVYIPDSEKESLLGALQSNQSYIDAWYNPPEAIADSLYLSDQFGTDTTEIDEGLESILESYRQEIKDVPFETLYRTFQGEITGEWVCSLAYTFRAEKNTYTLDLPIYADLMPKTAAKYYEIIYENQKPMETLQKIAEERQADDSAWTVYISAYGGSDTEYKNVYASFDSDTSSGKGLELILKYAADEPIQTGKSYAVINCWNDNSGDAKDCGVLLDDAFFEDTEVLKHFSFTYTEDAETDDTDIEVYG